MHFFEGFPFPHQGPKSQSRDQPKPSPSISPKELPSQANAMVVVPSSVPPAAFVEFVARCSITDVFQNANVNFLSLALVCCQFLVSQETSPMQSFSRNYVASQKDISHSDVHHEFVSSCSNVLFDDFLDFDVSFDFHPDEVLHDSVCAREVHVSNVNHERRVFVFDNLGSNFSNLSPKNNVAMWRNMMDDLNDFVQSLLGSQSEVVIHFGDNRVSLLFQFGFCVGGLRTIFAEFLQEFLRRFIPTVCKGKTRHGG